MGGLRREVGGYTTRFDHFAWWRVLVKEYKIQPSEAWQMDFEEIKVLAEISTEQKQDLSFMLNYERKQNGAGEDILDQTGGEWSPQ